MIWDWTKLELSMSDAGLGAHFEHQLSRSMGVEAISVRPPVREISESDRPAALRLLGIERAAEWAWTNADLARALEHGIEITNAGCRIMTDWVTL